jgi:hypothetical protein
MHFIFFFGIKIQKIWFKQIYIALKYIIQRICPQNIRWRFIQYFEKYASPPPPSRRGGGYGLMSLRGGGNIKGRKKERLR